jgi:hypothetical protein
MLENHYIKINHHQYYYYRHCKNSEAEVNKLAVTDGEEPLKLQLELSQKNMKKASIV